MSGYLLGVLSGVLLAMFTARSRFAEALLSPLRAIVKASPVTSFILLALLWLSSDMVPLFISFLMVVPMVWTATAEAIVQTDPRLVEMGKMFGLNRWQIVKKIYVPSVLPQFLAACTTSLGFAWKSGVAAEIIALPQQSIGYKLYQSKLRIETVDLFAWTLMIVALSMLLEWLLIKGMRRIRSDA
jgi:NitT/TauT family transport system permease protein